jgi:16S rRNA (guanine527-N7)-methyltransferase
MKRGGPKAVDRRLAELCAEFGLQPALVERFGAVLESLADQHSPTAVRDPWEGVDVHIADSLSALKLTELADISGVIADIGSGCGIPGLVLAAARPAAKVVAVEAIGKKCDFIAATAAKAGIANIEAVKSRAEEWNEGFGTCDVVTARALAPLSVLAEYAASMLKLGGVLIAWKGTPNASEYQAAKIAAGLLGMSEPVVTQVRPWNKGGLRDLVVMTKLAETPENFPRRAGIAVKRPLGT